MSVITKTYYAATGAVLGPVIDGALAVAARTRPRPISADTMDTKRAGVDKWRHDVLTTPGCTWLSRLGLRYGIAAPTFVESSLSNFVAPTLGGLVGLALNGHVIQNDGMDWTNATAVSAVVAGLCLLVFGAKGLPPIPVGYHGQQIPLNVLALAALEDLVQRGVITKDSLVHAGLEFGTNGVTLHFKKSWSQYAAYAGSAGVEFARGLLIFTLLTLAKGDLLHNGGICLVALESMATAVGATMVSYLWGERPSIGYARLLVFAPVNLQTGLNASNSGLGDAAAAGLFLSLEAVIMTLIAGYYFLIERAQDIAPLTTTKE